MSMKRRFFTHSRVKHASATLALINHQSDNHEDELTNTMERDDRKFKDAMAYTKMEQIVRDMQDPEKGVPVKCQKVFLTTIPSACTGSDLVSWLMHNLKMTETSEATHLATQLCQHGYVFPVTESKSWVVKDDSTLFRFQSPYYWPSQNLQLDNTDYAIYLMKRTLRNKQRHSLNDEEQAAFADLEQTLAHKWDFICYQAEEQVRLAQNRKKADKVVLDSQERAFWKIYRPPDGSPKHMAAEARRCKSAVTEVDVLRSQVELFKFELEQPRIKVLQSWNTISDRVQSFQEFDPFMTAPLPSNPWISDDPSWWTLNAPLVDVPTERRVRKWQRGFHVLLADPVGVREFDAFMHSTFSSENLHFWLDVEDLKKAPNEKVANLARRIYNKYIVENCRNEINIDSRTRDDTRNALAEPDRHMFNKAQEHIYQLMRSGPYQNFLTSEYYTKFLSGAAENPTTGGAKKKAQNWGK